MNYLNLNRIFVRTITIGLLGAFLAGCASMMYNPATGRKEFIIIPTDTEVSMGKSAHKQVASEFRIITDGPQAQRLYRIAARIAQVSDRQDYKYNFYLIEHKELNAFTTPGGNIYMFSGLMDKLPSDDAIAGVLAHEVGHCAARHTIKKFQAALGYDIIGSILLSRMETQAARQVASMGSNTLMSLVFSAYGRKDEYEADKLSLRYLHLAGFRMDGMIDALEVLKREVKSDHVPIILRSHPYLDDRITAIKKEIPNVPREFE